MVDRTGQQLGNYRLLHLLGEGGFAEVYLGEHRYLGTQAAVKLLSGALVGPEEVARFQQEARVIASLIHPNIVRVLEFGVENDLPYLVMDYAPGGTLRQQHPPGATVPLPLVVEYVQQIAQGLRYAHEHQVIHRDIKPQNLLLGRTGEVLLSDFGISVIVETTSRQPAQSFAGTILYTAPEQVQEHPRPASDQYALGIIIYEWLVGQPPFTGGFSEVAAKHLLTPPPSLLARQPALPPALEQVLFIALAKDPKDRFATIEAFAHAFAQASQSGTALFGRETASGLDSQVLEAAGPPLPAQPLFDSGGRSGSPASGAPSDQTEGSEPGSASLPSGEPQPDRSARPPLVLPPTPNPLRRRRLALSLVAILLLVLLFGGASAAYILGHAKPKTAQGGEATATALSTPLSPTPPPNPLAPYSASVPGPSCDQGTANWMLDSTTTQVSCTNHGLLTTQLAGNNQAEVFFTWPDHPFPRDYSVSLDISQLTTNGTCAGVLTRASNAGDYGLFVCSNDGSWYIDRDDPNGNSQTLAQGNVAPRTMYHLEVEALGSTQEIAINGGSFYQVSDSSFTTTQAIVLVVDATSATGTTGSAVFSNFVYTPMP